MLTKETIDGKVLIHSYRDDRTENKTILCIDCGGSFTEEVEVYLDVEIEAEDGIRKQCSKVSFFENERCPECRKIPKRRFFYDLAKMWEEDEERRKRRQ